MSPMWRSICPHKNAGLWPLPLKTAHSPQTFLAKCPSSRPSSHPPPPESYLEDPLQRLHVAAFAVHDGAQDVPPDHLPGPGSTVSACADMHRAGTGGRRDPCPPEPTPGTVGGLAFPSRAPAHPRDTLMLPRLQKVG